MAGLDTRVVHAGKDGFRAAGLHAPPIDRSTTFPVRTLTEGTADIDELAAGGHPRSSSVYARLHNPTVARWERAIASLEHADEAIAFGSGMAAVTAVLLAAGAAGHHVVALRPLYGGTDHLLSSGLLGMRTTWTSADGVADAIEPDTALVVMETPSNPTLALVDIAAVVEQAGEVPVLVDNTFATPVLQRPLDHGATWALHSATKALGGHGDVMGGVVACDADRARSLRQTRIGTGAVLDPQAAYLLHRSLATLALRVRAAQHNATELARRLLDHQDVARVHHPSLPSTDPSGLVGRQMDGPGAVLAFEVRSGWEGAARVMEEVALITPAVSLGSTETLIEHPAGLTHRVVELADQDSAGITPGMLRLSAGVEDVDDLWEDLCRALKAAGGA